MTLPQKPSLLEKSAGSLGTETAMTIIATLAGGLLAPLLPILTNTLAYQRQKVRVETALIEISENLASYGERLNEISDNQYKLVNETILAILQTADKEKLELLSLAVKNTLNLHELDTHEAYFLSRLVRDISVQEIIFLQQSFSHERIALVAQPTETDTGLFEIQINTPNGRLAAGLISLGILASVGGTYDDLGTFRFTPIAAKLLTLLQRAPESTGLRQR